MKTQTALNILGRGGLARACGISAQATYGFYDLIPDKYQDDVKKACEEKKQELQNAIKQIDKMIEDLEND